MIMALVDDDFARRNNFSSEPGESRISCVKDTETTSIFGGEVRTNVAHVTTNKMRHIQFSAFLKEKLLLFLYRSFILFSVIAGETRVFSMRTFPI
jgi:hypothetical protein